MSEDLSPIRGQLSLEHLLWRTRGRHWDYLFLVEPHAQYGHGWYSLHKEIFADSEPRPEGECYVLGELLDEQSWQRMVFVGTAFLDDYRRDAFGRPIAHYMVWLRPDKDLHEVKKSIPQDWGHAVLSRLGYALDADDVFNAVCTDDSRIRGAFQCVLAKVDRTIEIEGRLAECQDAGKIRKKTKSVINSTPSLLSGDLKWGLTHSSSHPDPKVAIKESGWDADVGRAILQGEAWALLYDRGWLVRKLPTLPLSLQEMKEADVLQRLVKSFSGSQDDKFIQARAELLPERIKTSYLPELSQAKGFDAVVDIFVQHGRHLELSRLVEDEACTLLAQQIGHGAAKTDLFIHNLYIRLCSQAKKQSPSEDASNTNAVQEDGDNS